MAVIRLRSVAALAGAGALALCSVMLLANMILGGVGRGYGIHFWSYPLFGDLSGVTEKLEKRRLTLHTALDGSFQAAYARLVGPRLPVFTFAVRLRNQAVFSLFSSSATPGLVVGEDGELIERGYIDDYCTRNLAGFVPPARKWATQIRQMQDEAERQGKTFLYVVTPSKVGQYPEFIPFGFPCPAAAPDRTGMVPAWLALVRNAGVHVVDTTAVITEAHGKYPFPLFPQGGTHWNAVGAALAGRSVVSGLSALRKDFGFLPLGFEWTMDHPSALDSDLVLLMNLLWPPNQPLTPAVTVQQEPASYACNRLSAVIVGGSFAHAIGESLSEQPCRPSVKEYEYWHTFVLTWREGKPELLPFSEAQRTQDLQDADIVLFEENEQLLGRSDHGRALYTFLLGHPP